MNDEQKLKLVKYYTRISLLVLAIWIFSSIMIDYNEPHWVGALLIGTFICSNGIVGLKTKFLLFKKRPGPNYYGDRKWGDIANYIIIMFGTVLILWGLYMLFFE